MVFGRRKIMYLKIRHLTKTVTTAGTRERLTTSDLKVPAVLIQAEVSNTGQVYVGDNQVSSSSCGIELDSGDSITLSAASMGWANGQISLKDIWLDVEVSTDGVWCTYLERA
jgi:hypothetical protein